MPLKVCGVILPSLRRLNSGTEWNDITNDIVVYRLEIACEI